MCDEFVTPGFVEVVRRFGTALSLRDFDAASSCFAPDAVYDASRAGVGTFQGPVAIRQFLEDWLVGYEAWENEWEEITDLGAGLVFTVNRQDGRPAGGRGRVQERYALTFKSAGTSLIDRLDVNQNIEEARTEARRLAAELE